MIKFPVTVDAGTASDINKTRLTSTVAGETSVVQEVDGNGASFEITVPEHSNGEVYSNYIDRAGNVSDDSPLALWVDASDTTPPAAPAGAPTLGAGESV